MTPLLVNLPLLAQLIAQAGSIRDAAAKWGISHDTLRRIRSGHMPRHDVLYRISTGAKVPVKALVKDSREGGTEPAIHEDNVFQVYQGGKS